MQKQHGPQGLVVVTVNLDPPGDRTTRERVLDFLKDHRGPITNVAAADNMALQRWSVQHAIEGIPLNVVYDRQGKLAQRIEGFDEAELTATVAGLLSKQ